MNTPEKNTDNTAASRSNNSSGITNLKLSGPTPTANPDSTRSSAKKPTKQFTQSVMPEESSKRSSNPYYTQSVVATSPKNAATASMQYTRKLSNDMMSMPYVKQGSLSNLEGQQQRSDSSMFTTDKTEWKHSEACLVCRKKFNKLKGILTHHCRLCKNSVCGDCSGKKIQENRVCDVCYTKATDHRAQDRRTQMVISKKELRYQYADDRKKYIQEAADIEKNIYELKQTLIDEEESQKKAIEALRKELIKHKDTVQKKSENNEKLKEALKSDRTLYFEKEKDYAELDRKLRIQNKDIQQKEEYLAAKESELNKLNAQKWDYENSQSFINASRSNEYQNNSSVFSSQYNRSVNSNPSIMVPHR